MPRPSRITSLILASTSFAALGFAADRFPASAEPELAPAILLGIGGGRCNGSGIATEQKLFYKIFTQTDEFKPFGRLPDPKRTPPVVRGSPPLWKNLGTLHYPVTTSVPLAQDYFNQGLRLTYAFNHAEAVRAYRRAQQLDPGCAMCYWGEALALGPNINMPMDADALAPALIATGKALSLRANANQREQALIGALAARYSADPAQQRGALDSAYADAMAGVSARYPNDQDIAVLYAESVMDLSPWDYWEPGGMRPKGRAGDAVQTLERVLAANPNHPGAIHYYIHAVEASGNPERAESHADRLAQLVPGAGHLVHMPAHIYYRVGRYQDSLALNKRAVAVDEAYIADQRPSGIYPLAYYPHNVHFVLASAQMAGDGSSVIEAANKLDAIVTDEAARKFVIAQPVKLAPYFAHAQFSRPEVILALPSPGSGMPYVKAMWHYARGVAFASQGDTERAAREARAIARLRQSADFERLTAAQIPAPAVMQLAEEVVAARIAQSRGDLTAALSHFKNAVALEDQLNYMEPPYWYYPVRQSLGAVQVLAGDLDGAEESFRTSLVRTPNNGWALYGLMQVYKERGDMRRVRAANKLFRQAWAGRERDLSLERL